ncbi:MAG: signal recognition particle-docking protein FtsY [Clostridia bacterium]|nr:signal recognition particle-docking protein FtsY [Clostridia bacterium]
MGLLDKIKNGLQKTRTNIFSHIDSMFKNFTKVDEELFERLLEVLVMGDVGIRTAEEICDELREEVKKKSIKEPDAIKDLLKEILKGMLNLDSSLHLESTPSVILVVGVNGVGKTTTIGKLAIYLKEQGKNVILGAADTFRAAAIDQLKIWADRAGVDLISKEEGSDPAAVVYDTISAAKKRNSDVIICDTAGRLHNKKNLMQELSKIHRIMKRELPNSSIEVLLVLDATTGQNAVNQTKEFQKATEITGIILTKLDGTTKGGMIFSINDEISIPVKFIGVGEAIDDLQPFDAETFVEALFS